MASNRVSISCLYFPMLMLLGIFGVFIPAICQCAIAQENGVQSSASTAEEWVKVGDLKSSGGETQQAIDAYKEAIRIEPKGEHTI